MAAEDTIREIIEAYTAGEPRRALFAEDFHVVGEAPETLLRAFAIPGARADGGRVTFEGITPSDGGHVLVWGTWSSDGETDATYHVVIEVRDGQAVESRFFDELEDARWFAGL